jgi:hypothetical protein
VLLGVYNLSVARASGIKYMLLLVRV